MYKLLKINDITKICDDKIYINNEDKLLDYQWHDFQLRHVCHELGIETVNPETKLDYDKNYLCILINQYISSNGDIKLPKTIENINAGLIPNKDSDNILDRIGGKPNKQLKFNRVNNDIDDRNITYVQLETPPKKEPPKKEPPKKEPPKKNQILSLKFDDNESDENEDMFNIPTTNEIKFNSKASHEFKYLSNFYGGVEICYMQKRFKHPKMKQLFEDFKTCSNEKFLEYLKILQPEKEGKWTPLKEKYWFTKDGDGNNEPIRGILAKLVGKVIQKPTEFKARIKAISQYLGISEEDVIMSDKVTTDEDMLDCVVEKFKIPFFRDLLLKTGDKQIYEVPMRGAPSKWTYKDGEGGNRLGMILMDLRSKFNISESETITKPSMSVAKPLLKLGKLKLKPKTLSVSKPVEAVSTDPTPNLVTDPARKQPIPLKKLVIKPSKPEKQSLTPVTSPSELSLIKQHLDVNGYCIIPNVLSQEEVSEALGDFKQWQDNVEDLYDPAGGEGKLTHKLSDFHLKWDPHGIYKHHEIGNQRHAWYIRTRPNVKNVFASIWDVSNDNLITSLDGSCYMAKDWPKKDNCWTHADQGPKRKGVLCYQGFVALTSNKKRTLIVYEGSHKLHESYFVKYPVEDEASNWQKIDPDYLSTIENTKRILDIPAGALVLWESRVFHQNQYGGANTEERYVQYVCMIPKDHKDNTKAMQAKRLKYFTERRTTSHWPAPIKVNGLQPQHRGNKAYEINYDALPKPKLEDLMPEIEKLL